MRNTRCFCTVFAAPIRPALQLRVRTTGTSPWHFCPGLTSGIHPGYQVFDAAEKTIAMGRGGMLEADVAPGQAIDLTLVVPALSTPGRYRLLVDLVEEGHCWF